MENTLPIKIKERLEEIRDSTNPGTDAASITDLLIQDVKEITIPESAFSVLDFLNSSSTDQYVKCFNKNVKDETQRIIREILIKSFLKDKNYEIITEYIKQVNYGSKYYKKEVYVMTRKFSLRNLVEILEQRFKVKSGERLKSRLTSSNSIEDSLRLIGKDGISYRATELKLSTVKKKVPQSKPSISDFKPNEMFFNYGERGEIRKLVEYISILNYNDFLYAISKFKLKKLDERVSKIEKSLTPTFWSSVLEIGLNFALPFAAGKFAKYVSDRGSNLIAKSPLSDVSTSLADIGITYIERVIPKNMFTSFSQLVSEYPKIAEGGIDDYVQFTLDGTSKIIEAYNKVSLKSENLRDFDAFIDKMQIVYRQASLQLVKLLNTLSDRDLVVQFRQLSNLGTDFYYDKISSEYKKLEEAQKKLEDELSESQSAYWDGYAQHSYPW